MGTEKRDKIFSMVIEKFIRNKLSPVPFLTRLSFHYIEYFNYYTFLLVIQLL